VRSLLSPKATATFVADAFRALIDLADTCRPAGAPLQTDEPATPADRPLVLVLVALPGDGRGGSVLDRSIPER